MVKTEAGGKDVKLKQVELQQKETKRTKLV